jgi:hypothetical protein
MIPGPSLQERVRGLSAGAPGAPYIIPAKAGIHRLPAWAAMLE